LTGAFKRLAKRAVIATVGGVVSVILGSFILGIALRLVGLGPIRSADVWYSPFVWWPGLLLGFLVNRRTLHKAACSVWFPGLLLLALGILNMRSRYDWTQVRINLFPLKQGECGTTECLSVLFYTWPALNAITYSIGAALGLRSKRDKADSEEPFTRHTIT
jgi:hypothetical protein